MANKSTRQVSIPTKFAYGLGTSVVSIKNMLFHFFFLYFFANVAGVSYGLVISAIMIALVVDAFTDPIMGQISDNARSKRWGRRHKFMLMGIIPTLAGLVMLFVPPETLGQMGLFLWMVTFLIVVRIGLTVYGVPYAALGSELSTNYNERTSIVAFREMFNNIFSVSVFVVGLGIFLPETPQFEDGMMNKAGYAPFVATMAAVGGAAALISIFGTKHKIPDIRRYENDPRTSWKDTLGQIKTAMKIRPFVWLCAGYCLILTLYATGSALSLYMGGYLWRLTQIQKALIAVGPVLVIVPTVIAATVLSAKMDKRPAVILFSLIYGIFTILPYALYFLGALPPVGTEALFGVVALFHMLSFLGLTGVMLISNSMIADIADVLDAQTGRRQEGILNAAFSFVQKLTFIIGTTIGSTALVLIKFPQQTQPSDVPQAIIDALGIVAIVTALVFTALGVFSYKRYAITRESMKITQAQLKTITD